MHYYPPIHPTNPMSGSSDYYVLSIDSGTTSCKASVWNSQGKMISMQAENLPRILPRAHYVEQDPVVIWTKQLSAIKHAIDQADINPKRIRSIGITNQRETVIAWDKESGRPAYNAITWLDRRTYRYGKYLREKLGPEIKRKTGLVVDPYFSATKMKWIINLLSRRNRYVSLDNIRFGTVDAWLVWNLTSGKVHATDWSNASRTMLFNIKDGTWDSDLLAEFDVSENMLPDVIDSSDTGIHVDPGIIGTDAEIGGIAGDQQSSLFGHLALEKGEMKNTYGTGSFLLVNAGEEAPVTHNLITTIAWKLKGSPPTYAVEGSAFNTGSLIDWVKEGLQLIRDSNQTEEMALASPDDHGLYFVPGLTGLGAPYWNSKVRGAIVGLTAKSTQLDIVRSALESIAYRTRDIVDAVNKETGIVPSEVKVDGKPTANNFLMQFQSDILQIPVLKYANIEITSAGAAYMAGLSDSFWDLSDLRELNPVQKEFTPRINRGESDRYYRGWKRAIQSTLRLYGR